ncbi:heavy-metal-associated domain-containing protein [Halobacteria archaeon HArc-gm2]|nr:heavy-metal-associated domain-containing protein [Halobacteria archaeon HArc-gm2]
MQQVALDVPGVRSRDAERAVTSALINLPGVQWVATSSPTGVVGIRFDPAATELKELLEAVEAAGYPSTF